MKFSVSMCVYAGDDPIWFAEAVESILHQTAKPDEVVLVVDGPVPEELDLIVSRYEQNPLFKVIRLAQNQGHGVARQTGLLHCSHELVALMDADDISVPDRFEKQLNMFREQPELAVVGGNIAEFLEVPENMIGVRLVETEDSKIKRDLQTRCPMNQVSAMLRKSRAEKVGGFIDWYCEEDYFLWIRLFLDGAVFANLPEYLVKVRVGKEMYRRRGGWRYFYSEVRLQKYMLSKQVIGYGTYLGNVAKRLVVQVLLPSCLRGWVFRRFARKPVNGLRPEQTALRRENMND